MRQIDGQMSIFDFIPEPDPVDEWELPCDTCKFDVKGCCAYNRPLGDFCRLGDKWQPKEPEECVFSGHTCNKTFLWQVADTLDEIMCPHVCCRKCNTRLCGARCNGSQEPKALTEKIHPVDIYGICDDAYCPECHSSLDETKWLDCERCPDCGIRIDWTPWHRMNDPEEDAGEDPG